MRSTIILAAAVMGLMALASATRASAADWYFDSGDFHALGAIQSATDFDSYSTNLTLLSDNETFGPLTFSGGKVIVVGSDSYLNPVKNVLANNYPDDLLDVSVDVGGYNMLAFKMGNLIGYGEQVFLALTTNLDTYYYGLQPQPAPEALSFYGFVVGDGEYFTSLQFNHTALEQSFGLTDIELGKTGVFCDTRVCEGGPVPEPSAWALMILGFGGVGVSLRTRRRLVLLGRLAS
jgi:hypothetical protein